jgi:hypothetical protein
VQLRLEQDDPVAAAWGDAGRGFNRNSPSMISAIMCAGAVRTSSYVAGLRAGFATIARRIAAERDADVLR